jgi:hypothetical protein
MSRARREFIQGLRALADFYQQNPRAYYDGMHLTLNMYIGGREARPILVEMARLFGHCRKTYDDRTVTLSRPFGEQITLAVFAPRERVCRRLVTGVRVLPACTVPATNELHIPARREPLVSWLCDPLLHPHVPKDP